MIDRFKALEKRFAAVHNHLELVSIEKLAIPVTKVEIEVLGQQIDDILPTTEFILRFIELGIDSIESLSQALGFDNLLVENLVVLEEANGNLSIDSHTSLLRMTNQGRETLTTKLASSPKVTNKSLIFNNSLWQIASWALSEFETKATLDKARVEFISVQKSKKTRVSQNDLDLTLVNRELARQSRAAKFEAHQLHRVITRKYGFKLAEIMVFYSETKGSDFVVIVSDERSIEHENYIKSIGGLQALGIDFEKVETEEKVLAMHVAEVPNDVIESVEDGGSILPYEHAPWLEHALEHSTRRLLIMSPWVNDRVVNKQFIEQIERLLTKKVEVVIAWGFGTDRESEAKKSSTWSLTQLLRLSNKYPSSFQFIKMNESHAKILISDDIYIATSFNWLSFMGDKRRKYRTEFGEMRNRPSIVQNRFELMLSECKSRGKPMTTDLIPN